MIKVAISTITWLSGSSPVISRSTQIKRSSRAIGARYHELAARPDEQLSAGEIGAKYGVSTHHLAKVLHGLRRSGLVRSVRADA